LILLAGGLLGALSAWLGVPAGPVHLTAQTSYVPAEAPWLHAGVVAATLGLLAAGVDGAVLAAAWLWEWGGLVPLVGVGLAASGLVGLALAVGGEAVGLEPGQRGSMGIVAVVLGGMGGLMLWGAWRQRARRR
jgi:hypothetical protein